MLDRALAAKFNKPIKKQSVEVFSTVESWLGSRSGPLVLDTGCGTGYSTLNLARAHPNASVIGFDQSADRLSRAPKPLQELGNVKLIRADAIDLWRLMGRAGLKIDFHYLFYPNPWPKIGQLRRRFHAHPVFPAMVQICKHIELRASWDIYAAEFAAALRYLGREVSEPELIQPKAPISLFEKKYLEQGTMLYGVKTLPTPDPAAFG